MNGRRSCRWSNSITAWGDQVQVKYAAAQLIKRGATGAKRSGADYSVVGSLGALLVTLGTGVRNRTGTTRARTVLLGWQVRF